MKHRYRHKPKQFFALKKSRYALKDETKDREFVKSIKESWKK